MATKLKRISISLPPELEHALNDLREASGIAPASIIVELMVDSLPMLRSLAQAATLIKHDKTQAFQVLGEALTTAMHQGSEAQMELMEATRKVRKTAGTVGKRRKCKE
ncbi:hypothetical protein [Pseudomonas aeruginosa]|uniref:hypothetical protein n=1 Tax=Pseudomonas aeruginosa TaxID=287 RepID=UPI00287AB314|nr:hypothetical protein [Pseudomonas aeruginosa]MDS4340680.1 hypothetical protein [Pseudomonas aeruginosa]